MLHRNERRVGPGVHRMMPRDGRSRRSSGHARMMRVIAIVHQDRARPMSRPAGHRNCGADAI